MMEKRFYSMKETSTYLAVCLKTVYNLIESGDLIRVYQGTRPTITAVSLIAYADRMEEDARVKRERGREQARKLLGLDTTPAKKTRLRMVGK